MKRGEDIEKDAAEALVRAKRLQKALDARPFSFSNQARQDLARAAYILEVIAIRNKREWSRSGVR